MKKIFFLLFFIALVLNLFSQSPTMPVTKGKNDYLQKSRKQSTVALAIGIPGSLLLTIGGVIYISEFDRRLYPVDNFDKKKFRTGEALISTGCALLAVAIPFKLAARKNKKKAMTIGMKTEPVHLFQHNNLLTKALPSLTLKISL